MSVFVRNVLQLFLLPSNIKSYKVFTSWSSLWTDIFYLYHIVIIQFIVLYIDIHTQNICSYTTQIKSFWFFQHDLLDGSINQTSNTMGNHTIKGDLDRLCCFIPVHFYSTLICFITAQSKL